MLIKLLLLTCSMVPQHTLDWHTGAVSSARFCGRNGVATAATDGTVACWDLAANGGSGGATLTAPSQVMRGHEHRRNFVGLSVLHPGVAAAGRGDANKHLGGHILACGSEDAVVHAYHSASVAPYATWPLTAAPAAAGSGPFFGGKDEAVVPLRAEATPQQLMVRQDARSGKRREFVSSVAWAPPGAAASDSPLLAVAASDGELRVLSLQGGSLF